MDDIDEQNLPDCKFTFTGRKCPHFDLQPHCAGCEHLAEYRAEYESAQKPTYTPGFHNSPRPSAYERTKAQVYATGNKWAIENFHATHD